ncbi:hypothetical protein GCM10020331_091940 [Ectobacillus funiculus]
MACIEYTNRALIRIQCLFGIGRFQYLSIQDQVNISVQAIFTFLPYIYYYTKLKGDINIELGQLRVRDMQTGRGILTFRTRNSIVSATKKGFQILACKYVTITPDLCKLLYWDGYRNSPKLWELKSEFFHLGESLCVLVQGTPQSPYKSVSELISQKNGRVTSGLKKSKGRNSTAYVWINE